MPSTGDDEPPGPSSGHLGLTWEAALVSVFIVVILGVIAVVVFQIRRKKKARRAAAEPRDLEAQDGPPGISAEKKLVQEKKRGSSSKGKVREQERERCPDENDVGVTVAEEEVNGVEMMEEDAQDMGTSSKQSKRSHQDNSHRPSSRSGSSRHPKSQKSRRKKERRTSSSSKTNHNHHRNSSSSNHSSSDEYYFEHPSQKPPKYYWYRR